MLMPKRRKEKFRNVVTLAFAQATGAHLVPEVTVVLYAVQLAMMRALATSNPGALGAI